MDARELDSDVERTHQPRTTTVLVFLAAFAVITSWLGIYAVTNALIAADVIAGWSQDVDPRPRWMFNAFVALFLLFAVVGPFFRWISHRQLRRIDSIAEAGD